ncbi:MAG: hypothetical protein AAFP82_20020, partial [Bacteroidota bacterium]
MKWKNTFMLALLLGLVSYLQAQEIRQEVLWLELLHPHNKSTVKVSRPVLNWNAFASNRSISGFDLKLVKKGVRQTTGHALRMNTPLI